MWSRRRLVAAAAASLSLPASAQFRIDISGIGATQVPIAVAAFRGEAGQPQSPSAIARADLERSGVFRFVEAPPALDERSAVPQAELRSRGADALLAGSIARLADGNYELRYRLWDAIRGSEHFARSATVPAADLRLAAHRIADEVYEKLTGDRGVFATRIAFVTRAGRQFALHVTDADGEGGQIALQSPEPIISPAWSPDGRSIAYVSFETQKAVIWVQDVRTGGRKVVASLRGSNSAPAWSPDGRELAVTLSQGGPAQLHVIQRDGAGSPRRLTSSNAIDTEPVYAPDGRTVYFVSDRGGGPQIYRIPAAGGAVERVTFRGDYNISPAISPDGSTLAYIARSGSATFRVTTLDLGTGTIQTLTDTNDDESPGFAPNGRLLVYASRASGRDVLMTTTLDGKIKTRLLSTTIDMREPAWGPFGR